MGLWIETTHWRVRETETENVVTWLIKGTKLLTMSASRFSQDSRVSISIEHRFSNNGLYFEPYTLGTGDYYFHKVSFMNTENKNQC